MNCCRDCPGQIPYQIGLLVVGIRLQAGAGRTPWSFTSAQQESSAPSGGDRFYRRRFSACSRQVRGHQGVARGIAGGQQIVLCISYSCTLLQQHVHVAVFPIFRPIANSSQHPGPRRIPLCVLASCTYTQQTADRFLQQDVAVV